MPTSLMLNWLPITYASIDDVIYIAGPLQYFIKLLKE
jgi:hypothetical protein